MATSVEKLNRPMDVCTGERGEKAVKNPHESSFEQICPARKTGVTIIRIVRFVYNRRIGGDVVFENGVLNKNVRYRTVTVLPFHSGNMKRSRVFLLVVLISATFILGVGIIAPEIQVATTTSTGRSAPTTYAALSSFERVGSWITESNSIDLLEQHSDLIGNKYRVEGQQETVWELEIEQAIENELLTVVISNPLYTRRIEAIILPGDSGSEIQFSEWIQGTTWWTKTTLLFTKQSWQNRLGRFAEEWVRQIAESNESIVGEWTGIDSSGATQMFTFRSDRTVEWKVESGGSVFQLSGLSYEQNDVAGLRHLDISGFRSGPLEGLILYGLVDLSRPDTLIYDAEAGDDDEEDLRPNQLTDSAVTYTRIK